MGNYITVPDTEILTLGTPLVFTEDNVAIGDPTLGGLIAGQIYYFKARNPENSTQFTVSSVRDGDEVTLTTDTGTMRVCQWQQENVDRLWVTVNGYRVPSSALKINAGNYISILTEIVAGDTVIITSMMPSATPGQEVYIQYANQLNETSVYRANSLSRTWLTQPFFNTTDTIHVNDVTALTNTIVQEVTAPSPVSSVYSIGLEGDKTLYSSITVYNNTKSALIASSHYSIEIEDTAPILKIAAGAYIAAGDSLTITILEGTILYMNGEQIRFTDVDFDNNTLSGLQLGFNGTPNLAYFPEYTEVYSMLGENRMSSYNYEQTWNSYTYNTVLGDPLQISTTNSAIFLNQDQT